MLANTVEEIWHALVQIYKEFSVESSIHGIKYTTQAKSSAVRLIWLIIITLSLLAAVKLATVFYGRHKLASMSTVIVTSQYPSRKIAFPAITLCHANVAVLQKVLPFLTSQKQMCVLTLRYMPRGLTQADFQNSLRYLREAIHPKNRYPEEMDKLQQILTANRLSLSELFEIISPNCSDFLVLCKLEEAIHPCEKLMEPVMTSYGICCTFNYENPLETLERSQKEYYSVNYGNRYVVSFLLRPVPLEDRISSIIYGDGIKVFIHEKHTYPGPTAIEFVASSGYETIAKLYSIALISSPEVLRLSPEVRGCYTTSTTDKILYRAENCYVRCREMVIQKLCNCVPFSASIIPSGEQICNLTHISCLARITLQTYTLMLWSPECKCLPNCEGTAYKASVTTLPMSAARFRPGKFYEKAAKQSSNATALHITLAGQSGELTKRELVLSWINLLSSLGGIFGLFLGCSFISLFEVIYFFCFNFFYKLRYKEE